MLQVQIPSDPLTSLFQPVEASTTVSHFLLHPRALTLILAFMSRNSKNKRVPTPPPAALTPARKKKGATSMVIFGLVLCPSPASRPLLFMGFLL